MKDKTKGILYAITAAVIFGFTPILARIAYDGGSNGVTMTFFRALLAIPVLFVIVKAKGVSLKLTGRELKELLIAGGIGSALTTTILYMSYSYISVGLATTLHFIYPVTVTLGCVIFYGEKMSPLKVAALVAATVGILLFIDTGASGSLPGLVLSLASGVTFAFYMIYLDKSTLRYFYYFKLSFYLCVIAVIVSGTVGLATGMLTFSLTPKAWGFTAIVSMMTSIFGLALFQLGVRFTGATTAAILSTFEPITSVVFGVLILGETLSALKLVGCALILASIVLIAREGRERMTTADDCPQEKDTVN